ncbi:hypothetical protein Tco_0751167 [Tanacetum coccineum]|uniref:Reverse transcriptase domain-containing protein n=1 Tax=Tanacetum coccineum TaxID=301880 RepID=A0ABQ4Z4U7_9ASTR
MQTVRRDGVAGFKRRRRNLSSDEIPIEDQSYAAAASPIPLSLGYIANSNLEEDLEDELEDGPAEYLADGGDDDDDSFEVGESSTAAAARQPGLGMLSLLTMDELVDAIQEGAPTTLEGVNARVTELAETHERHNQDLYAHLEDVQDSRAYLSGRVDILLKDRQFHQQTFMLMEDEALFAGDIDSNLGCSGFITIEPTDSNSRSDSGTTGERSSTLLWVIFLASTAIGLVFSFISVSNYHKMAPRRGTRTTPATTTATTTTPMTDAAIRALIAQGVADALAGRTIQINTNLNDDGSQGSGSGITRPMHPTQWRLSSISVTVQSRTSKFATLQSRGVALTCYTQRFQELALMCERMFPEESGVVAKYVGGLPDMIQGNVMSTKPKIIEEAIEMANNLMDQKLCTLVERQIENKRKQDDDSRNNQN